MGWGSGWGGGNRNIRRVVHDLNQESFFSLRQPQGGTHRFQGWMASEGPVCRARSHRLVKTRPASSGAQTKDTANTEENTGREL